MVIYDMHSHLYEFSDDEVSSILDKDKDLMIVAVSDDLSSLYRNLRLYDVYPDRIIPCAGFHPWAIGDEPLLEAEEIARRAVRLGLQCIGEVGLDKKFVEPSTWRIQEYIFSLFIDTALELNAFINIHAPGAWRDVLRILVDSGVEKAMFHWYTGPLDMIDILGNYNYKVSINPAIRVQAKHRRVALSTAPEYMVFESDGPYNYRGLRLNPLMVRDTVRFVAELKGVSLGELLSSARLNSEFLIYG